jgi:hypothetical protein
MHGESEDALMGRQLCEQWDKVVGGQREQLIFGAMMLKLRVRVGSATRSQLAERRRSGNDARKGNGAEGLADRGARAARGGGDGLPA